MQPELTGPEPVLWGETAGSRSPGMLWPCGFGSHPHPLSTRPRLEDPATECQGRSRLWAGPQREVSRLYSTPLQSLRGYSPPPFPLLSSPSPSWLPSSPLPGAGVEGSDPDTSGDTSSVVHWRLVQVPGGAEIQQRETQLQPKPGV